jgi:DNA (cytosine-5)-methyltransferase 1
VTARTEGRVAELFAGVGGFRLGLEGHPALGLPPTGWRVVWSNQWEPATRRQDASDCYVSHFGSEGHINDDIAAVLDGAEVDQVRLPEIDLVVGGFPCQDYSVARVLSQAAGLAGKKGVLWWEILRLLKLRLPRFILLENVDRLLRSPATQRGRDFGVMLRCLADLGYLVEWRVVNAADYGFPQRRRRTFIAGRLLGAETPPFADALDQLLRDGTLAQALPAELSDEAKPQMLLGVPTPPNCLLPGDLEDLSNNFAFEFRNAGVMHRGRVWTFKVRSAYDGPRVTLRDVLMNDSDVSPEFFIPNDQLPQWRYLKGAKREERTAGTGFRYFYAEGALPFPDPLDQPSRTILTGEGGPSPSRFKHVIQTGDRFRRLTPVELERLDGFPDGWTDTGMTEKRRAFCMGNALVVGLVHRIARELSVIAGLGVTTAALRRSA